MTQFFTDDFDTIKDKLVNCGELLFNIELVKVPGYDYFADIWAF